MAAENFRAALRLVLKHEGGYSNLKADPGGATMAGVTHRTYDAWRRSKGLKTRPVRQIEEHEIEEIYREQYWDTIRADELPAGVDYATFDYAVNSGPRKAVMDLQREAGAHPDGIVGALTLAAVHKQVPNSLINRYCDRRLRFLKSLRTWNTFGKGWSRRVAEVRRAALTMSAAMPVTQDPAPVDVPKGNPADIPVTTTPEGKGVTTTGFGAIGLAITWAIEQLEQRIAVPWVPELIVVLTVLFILATIGGAAWTLYGLMRRKDEGGLA